MRIRYDFIIYLFLLCTLLNCNSGVQLPSSFKFLINEDGIELRENDQLILCYQQKIKSFNGKYSRNNYIHPLMSLDGDTLTEDFPEDHLHHRGIFWAWHQIYFGNKKIADSWSLNNFNIDIIDINSSIENESANIKIHGIWNSYINQIIEPIIEENTNIIIHKLENDIRKIDFEIALHALIPDIRIGGSDDNKGYGGFSIRIKMPDGLTFTAENGQIKPQKLQIQAGPWMDFSAPFGTDGEVSGITLLCHPSSPNFPEPWILRQKRSMQNLVFPGRELVELKTSDPIVLHYRLIVHRGNAKSFDIKNWQSAYETIKY
jgi:hypothetical protein